MNNNKFAFIICSNNDTFLNECKVYLNRLIVPEGMEWELIVVKAAKSMLLGMNDGRNKTDAKYKIYMHQDVFIINKFFLRDIKMIFDTDSKIGMIGMVGLNYFPKDGIWLWNEKRVGGLYNNTISIEDYKKYNYADSMKGYYVDVIDGFLMATSYDIPFRTDIIEAWDFYDVSTSLEYLRAGYKVFVPDQECPWCLHDDGRVLNLLNYNKYRKVVIEEYKDLLKDEITIMDEIQEKLKNNELFLDPSKTKIENLYRRLSEEDGQLAVLKNYNIRNLYRALSIYMWESEAGEKNIFEGVYSLEDIEIKMNCIYRLLYRIASGNLEQETFDMFEVNNSMGISIYAYVLMSEYLNVSQEKTINDLAELYFAYNKKKQGFRVLMLGLKMHPQSEQIPLNLVDKYLNEGELEEAKIVIQNSVLKDDSRFNCF